MVFFKALAGLNAPALRDQPAIGFELWLVLTAGAIGCRTGLSTVRRWTVAVDALMLLLEVVCRAFPLRMAMRIDPSPRRFSNGGVRRWCGSAAEGIP